MAAAPFQSRPAMSSFQLAKIQRLLRDILPDNGFYARKLGLRAAPQITTYDQFRRLPFTTKAELVADQRDRPPFGTNLTFPLERYTRYHQTSGTTGTPLRWLDTPESWDWMVASWVEIFRAAEVGPADRILFAFSFGPFIGFWLAFEAGTRLGAMCLPSGGLSSSARLRMLLDNNATVLCCTPTYALRLAEVARQEKLAVPRGVPRIIIVAGEPGGSIPGTRARLESLWPGTRIFDHHGMTETGPVTYECPLRPGFLHVMESAYLAEVIDPETGEPQPPGREGELVLTTLGRTGSPLIRYRTGDLVKVEPGSCTENSRAEPGAFTGDCQPCGCGRQQMTLAGGILGRVDDMVIVRGVNVYPAAVEHVLLACGGVGEYQVKVMRSGALTELVLAVEPDGAGADPRELVERIQKCFQTTFALRVPVQVMARGSLPRAEMKARRWVVEGHGCAVDSAKETSI